MENTTRISDLPDNITMQLEGAPTNYIPMNIHSNPYGISAQNPIMPIPQQPTNDFNNKQIQTELQNMPHVRLPSRDIPVDTIHYSNDEEVQPNYIPKTKLTKDYIREHEEVSKKNLTEYERKKHRENKLDEIWSELQIPIFIAILFFFFQLPVINILIFKKFSFLSIYNDDGNFNFYGLILKSIMFGLLYYSTQKVTTFIVEF